MAQKVIKNTLICVFVLAVINALVCGVAEGNKIIWFGVLTLVGSIAWYATTMNENHDWWYYTRLCFATVFALFFVIAPFLHLGGGGKVWIVDDETTINHEFLWRSPFSKFATSINEKQNISLVVSGKTKDNTAVVATLSGEFRVSNDEKVVIKHFGKMQNPDTETTDILKKVFQKSFEQTISTKTVTDLVTAKNNFSIEHAIVTMTAVDSLGFKGSGPIVVSGLHPYFGGK